MSVSCVTMGLSGIHLLMSKFTEDLHTKFGKHMCSLMFVWSFIGACFLTFDKPFVNTGNGYFSAWATVFGSAMAMGVNAEALGSKLKGLGSVMSLLASSVVVFLASAAPIRDDDPNKSEAFYACILAVVTFVVLGLVVLMDNRDKALPPKLYFGMMAIFSACWIVMAFLVTFRGPFDVTGKSIGSFPLCCFFMLIVINKTYIHYHIICLLFLSLGNGYFGSWVGALASSFATFAAKKAL